MVCELRVIFFISTRYVTMIDLVVSVHNKSEEGSERALRCWCFTTAESRAKIWPVKLIYPPPPVALGVGRHGSGGH